MKNRIFRKNIRAITAALPLLLLATGVIAVFLYPFVLRNPQPLLNLSSEAWHACYESAPGKDCELFPITVPRDITWQKDRRFKGTIFYTVQFYSPPECISSSSGCSLYISELGDAATFQLNGKELYHHGKLPPNGRYAKHYPINVKIPSEFFLNGQKNLLNISVFSFKNVQAGIRKGPVGIFAPDDAFALARAQITQNTIIPLICASLIFLIALLSAVFVFFRRLSTPQLQALITYCIGTSFFLFSFTETPREFLPIPFAGFLHYTSRLFSDLCFFELIRTCFFPSSLNLKKLRTAYFVTVLIYPVLFVIQLSGGTFEVRGFDDAYLLTRFAFPLLLLPHLMGLFGSYRLKKSRLRISLFSIFLITTICQINDSLVFHAFIAGAYFIKAYPILIALGMAWYTYQLIAKEIIEQTLKLKTEALLGSLAAQVSHDIRSPLAALHATIHNAKGLDEQTRVSVRTAIQSIREIANNLLTRNRQVEQSSRILGNEEHMPTLVASFSTELKSAELLSALLESFISQKRLQFIELKDLHINFECSTHSKAIFVEIQPIEFGRVISNLINNSVEAFAGQGSINVTLTKSNEHAIITIQDDGKGIPGEILGRLGQRGATFGKEGGNGLGLFHAKKAVQAWRGTFSIQSKPDSGTMVRLSIPTTTPAAWFAAELTILPKTTVVIVDADPLVHETWQLRLDESTQVSVVPFYSPQELLTWYRSNPMNSKVLYLVGHEFVGQNENGLQLIEMIGIMSFSVLITNHWEDLNLRRRCEKLRLKLLPKSMIGTLPIKATSVLVQS